MLSLCIKTVSRNANTTLHMRYSHALNWNPKSGELRALVLPKDGGGGEPTSQEDSARLQLLNPAKGEKFHVTNMRLNVSLGPVLGYYRRTNNKTVEQPQKDFPECLPDLYQKGLTFLLDDVSSRRLRDWIIPSVAKSISLCIDVIGRDSDELRKQLLQTMHASSDADVLAKICCHLHSAMTSNEKKLSNKRGRMEASQDCHDGSEESDSSSVFTSDAGLIGFLKCKDLASHSKLKDFVDRSITRFLRGFLSCVAQGGLPSIHLYAETELDPLNPDDPAADSPVASQFAEAADKGGQMDAENERFGETQKSR